MQGDDRLTSYTSYISNGSPPVTKDGSNSEGLDPSYKSVQENHCLGCSQSSPELVCMSPDPIPQELRRAVVTGRSVNREWLTPTLRSNTGTACMSIVCQGEDGDKESDDEDSKKRKRKTMDRLVSDCQL